MSLFSLTELKARAEHVKSSSFVSTYLWGRDRITRWEKSTIAWG